MTIPLHVDDLKHAESFLSPTGAGFSQLPWAQVQFWTGLAKG